MSSVSDSPKRDRWAHLRFSIIGNLLAAPPETGQLFGALVALAKRAWRHPQSGLDVHFSAATLERWYYAARRSADPLSALKDRCRGDIGRFHSIAPQVIEVLSSQYREHPGWTMQLHLDNLRAALASSDCHLPSYPTLRRYLQAHGMFRQARPKRATAGALAARDRLERLEVRSFEVDHVNALWRMQSSAICGVVGRRKGCKSAAPEG